MTCQMRLYWLFHQLDIQMIDWHTTGYYTLIPTCVVVKEESGGS